MEIGQYPAIVAVSTTQVEVTLSVGRSHSVVHNGVDTSGNAATDEVVISIGADVTATWAEGENKLALQSGEEVALNPGIDTINLKQPAGKTATSVTVIPHTVYLGK
jgi:hypothetical protein